MGGEGGGGGMREVMGGEGGGGGMREVMGGEGGRRNEGSGGW